MSNEFLTRDYTSRTLPPVTPEQRRGIEATQSQAALAAQEADRARSRRGSAPDDPANKPQGDDSLITESPVARSQKYYFKMRFYDYKKPMPTYGTDISDGGIGQVKKIFNLPLPLGLYDQTNVAYSNPELQLLGDINFNSSSTSASGAGEFLKKQLDSAVTSAVNRGFFTGISDSIQAAINMTPVLGGNVGDVSALLQQSFGATVNPNEALTLQGPGLRSWSFRWVFLPHTSDESEQIQLLIQQLKARSLPFIAKSVGSDGQASGLLGYPQICMINTYPWDDTNVGSSSPTSFGWTDKSIMKIKRTMLSSVNVNYNSQGSPAFFKGTNNPVSIELALGFKEIEYFLAEDEAAPGYDIPSLNTPVSNIQDFAEGAAESTVPVPPLPGLGRFRLPFRLPGGRPTG